jgi:hypothetical protein
MQMGTPLGVRLLSPLRSLRRVVPFAGYGLRSYLPPGGMNFWMLEVSLWPSHVKDSLPQAGQIAYHQGQPRRCQNRLHERSAVYDEFEERLA